MEKVIGYVDARNGAWQNTNSVVVTSTGVCVFCFFFQFFIYLFLPKTLHRACQTLVPPKSGWLERAMSFSSAAAALPRRHSGGNILFRVRVWCWRWVPPIQLWSQKESTLSIVWHKDGRDVPPALRLNSSNQRKHQRRRNAYFSLFHQSGRCSNKDAACRSTWAGFQELKVSVKRDSLWSFHARVSVALLCGMEKVKVRHIWFHLFDKVLCWKYSKDLIGS